MTTKEIIAYDIATIPSELSGHELLLIKEEMGILLYDSKKGNPPTVLLGTDGDTRFVDTNTPEGKKLMEEKNI